MEEEIGPTPEYIIGFNQGYIMAENLPDLLKSILSTSNKENERLSGMKAGRDQFERDAFLKEVKRNKQSQKDKEQER